MNSVPGFYCQLHSGQEDFSIDEWNEAAKQCDDMGLSDKEADAILFPEPCQKQCDRCADIVLDRRLKTLRLHTPGAERKEMK